MAGHWVLDSTQARITEMAEGVAFYLIRLAEAITETDEIAQAK